MFQLLHEFGLSVYKNVHGNQKSVRNQILLRGSQRHISLAQKILILMLIGIFFFVVIPIYSYMDGDRPHVVLLLIPFINPDTTIGYHSNVGYQLVFCSWALCGVLGVELFMIELVSVYAQATDLIEFNCQELSRNKSPLKNNSLEVKVQLRNLLVQMQDLNKWVILRDKDQFERWLMIWI